MAGIPIKQIRNLPEPVERAKTEGGFEHFKVKIELDVFGPKEATEDFIRSLHEIIEHQIETRKSATNKNGLNIAMRSLEWSRDLNFDSWITRRHAW